MAHNIAKNAVERTSDELLGRVFPDPPLPEVNLILVIVYPL